MKSDATYYHRTVLCDQVVNALEVNSKRVVVDATLGDGGHSIELLKKMSKDAVLIGVDRDSDAIARAQARMQKEGYSIQILHDNYSQIDRIAEKFVFSKVDAIVADLGVSQYQISEPERGFMFMQDGPLSMEMGVGADVNAFEVVNEFSEKELADIFWQYGEEKASRRIARKIMEKRLISPINTTNELAEIVKSVVPNKYEIKTLARIFQAIRIRVNNELESLEMFLDKAVKMLNVGGRLAVISYHSLEDRIVKNFYRNAATDCVCPPEIPICQCDKKAELKIIGKMIVPNESEIELNPSARSAKLRVAEKI